MDCQRADGVESRKETRRESRTHALSSASIAVPLKTSQPLATTVQSVMPSSSISMWYPAAAFLRLQPPSKLPLKRSLDASVVSLAGGKTSWKPPSSSPRPACLSACWLPSRSTCRTRLVPGSAVRKRPLLIAACIIFCASPSCLLRSSCLHLLCPLARPTTTSLSPFRSAKRGRTPSSSQHLQNGKLYEFFCATILLSRSKPFCASLYLLWLSVPACFSPWIYFLVLF